MIILIRTGSSLASIYSEVIETIHRSKAIEHTIDIITLDDVVKKNNIDKIDLLKIDTEGNELECLKGFENFIRQGKVNVIHFEFNEMNVISRVFFKDFWDFLPNYNFYRMLPSGLLRIKEYEPTYCEIFAYQNIVCILKEFDKGKKYENISLPS
ncbi:MAG: FkbM family methyltransferase [Brevinematia bacterium]